MSSVHYKFKSALTYDTITFDGLHISVKDLKKAILQQKQIGKTSDFDLQITNAQTNEVYVDENALIAKNSSLIIVRVPLSAQQKRAWERAEANQQLGGALKPGSTINFDGQDSEVQKLAKAVDLSSLDASEDDKILAMMTQSTLDYDPANYMRIRGSNQVGEVPPNYRCYKCHQPGHWIKDCRLNASQEATVEIRKSTGIPRSFMVPVEGPSVPGAMMTPTGQFAVPQIDHQAYQEAGRRQVPPPEEATEKPTIPDDLLCSICQDLLTDAVMIPCCGNSFCDDCIRNVLLESDNHQCPDCKECSVSPDTLIPNRFLRNAVNNFRNQTGYHGRVPPQSAQKPPQQPEINSAQQSSTQHQYQQQPPVQQQQSQGPPLRVADDGRLQHGKVKRPTSAENDVHVVHPLHQTHPRPVHAAVPQPAAHSMSNISVVSSTDLERPTSLPSHQMHPPPPGNILSHPGAGQPILTIGAVPSQPPYNQTDYLDVNINSGNGPNQSRPLPHVPPHPHLRPQSQPNNMHRYPIPTANTIVDHAPPGVEDGPPLQMHPNQLPENIPKQPSGILSQQHRGSLEERSGTPTVDEQNSSTPLIPDMSQPPPTQQPAYQIPSFPPPNRPPPYAAGYGPPHAMPPHGYAHRGHVMPPYGGMPPHSQGYPMDNMRGGMRGYRGYSRGRARGMHPSYRGGPHNGNQVGVIDDPLAAFERMLQEKDSRDRHLRRHRKRSYSRSRSKSPLSSRPRRRSGSRSYDRSLSRSKSRSRTHSRTRSRSGSLRSRPRTPPPSAPPRSRSVSRSRSRTPRTPARSCSRSITPRRSRTRTHTRTRSRSPRSRTRSRSRSRSRSVRARSKTPVVKKKKGRSRSRSGTYSFSLSRSRSRSLSRSLSPRVRDRGRSRDIERDRDQDKSKDRRYSPHRRDTSRYRSPPHSRSPQRYIPRFNKELDGTSSYIEPEPYHRGYYRGGRGRGRYQSIVRKAMGRIGPPGGGADGPPSYYNADSYSANRYSGDARYDPNHGGRSYHQGPQMGGNRSELLVPQSRYGQRRYDQYEHNIAVTASAPEIQSVAYRSSGYQDEYMAPAGVPDHRSLRDRELNYQNVRENPRDVTREWERTRDREIEQRERERTRDYEDRYYQSSKHQSRSPSRERHHRRSREHVKENKAHPVEALEGSLRDYGYDIKDDSRNCVLLDLKKEPSMEKEKKKERDVDSSPVKEKKRDKEKKKKKKDADIEKKKKKKKEKKESTVKGKTDEKEVKLTVSGEGAVANIGNTKSEPAVDPLYGDLEGTRIDQSVVENYGKVSEGGVSAIDASVIEVIQPTDPNNEKSGENVIKENVMLAPVPELSKWELDDDIQSNEERSGGESGPSAGDKKVVTSEVLKRAENVIFQKAVNAIRPFDLKRQPEKSDKVREKKDSSPETATSTGLDNSREARKAGNSIQVTIPSIPVKSSERSVEVAVVNIEMESSSGTSSKPKLDRSKFNVTVGNITSPVRVSAKDRLGAKVDDYERLTDDVSKRVRSAVERKSRSHSPKKYMESRKTSDTMRDRHRDREQSPNRERRVIVGSIWGNRERSDRRIYDDSHKDRKHRERERERDRKREPSTSHDKRIRRDRDKDRKHSDKTVSKNDDEKSKTEDKKLSSDAQKKEDLERKSRKNPRLASDKRKPTLDEASFEPDYDESSSPESEPEVPGEEKNLLIIASGKSDSPAKKRSRSPSTDKTDKKKLKSEPSMTDVKQDTEKPLKQDVEKIAKKIEIDSGDSSESDSSSDTSSDSSVEVRKKRKKKRSKKKKKKKNRKKRKDSSSESESSESSSSDSDTEKSKKKKHKHKTKKTKSKKRKKSKHK